MGVSLKAESSVYMFLIRLFMRTVLIWKFLAAVPMPQFPSSVLPQENSDWWLQRTDYSQNYHFLLQSLLKWQREHKLITCWKAGKMPQQHIGAVGLLNGGDGGWEGRGVPQPPSHANHRNLRSIVEKHFEGSHKKKKKSLTGKFSKDLWCDRIKWGAQKQVATSISCLKFITACWAQKMATFQ
jgi:hypothetical protein